MPTVRVPLPQKGQPTSSAYRLYSILKYLKSTERLQAEPMYRAVPKVLGVLMLEDQLLGHASFEEETELGMAFARDAGLIRNLLLDFTGEIRVSSMPEEQKNYFLLCRPSILNRLAPVRLSLQWEQVRTQIDDALLVKLESAHLALRQSVKEQTLGQADLNQLRQAMQAALELPSASSLPVEIRSFVASQLIKIKVAKDEYQFRGVAGLREFLAGYLGVL